MVPLYLSDLLYNFEKIWNIFRICTLITPIDIKVIEVKLILQFDHNYSLSATSSDFEQPNTSLQKSHLSRRWEDIWRQHHQAQHQKKNLIALFFDMLQNQLRQTICNQTRWGSWSWFRTCIFDAGKWINQLKNRWVRRLNLKGFSRNWSLPTATSYQVVAFLTQA